MDISSKNRFLFCKPLSTKQIVGTMFGGERDDSRGWYVDNPGLGAKSRRSERFTIRNANAFLSLFEALFERLFYTTHGDRPDGQEEGYGPTSRELYGFRQSFGYDLLEEGDEARMLPTLRTSLVVRNKFFDLANALTECNYHLFCHRGSFGNERSFWSSSLYGYDVSYADGEWMQHPFATPAGVDAFCNGFASFDCLASDDYDERVSRLRWIFNRIRWENAAHKSALDDIPDFDNENYPNQVGLVRKFFPVSGLKDANDETARFDSTKQSEFAATIATYDRCFIPLELNDLAIYTSKHRLVKYEASIVRTGYVTGQVTTEEDSMSLTISKDNIGYDNNNNILSRRITEQVGGSEGGYRAGVAAGVGGTFSDIGVNTDKAFDANVTRSSILDVISQSEEYERGDEYKVVFDFSRSTIKEGYIHVLVYHANKGVWSEEFVYSSGIEIDTFRGSSSAVFHVDFPAKITMGVARSGMSFFIQGSEYKNNNFARPCKEATEDGVLKSAKLIMVSSIRVTSDIFRDYSVSNVGLGYAHSPTCSDGVVGTASVNDEYSVKGIPVDIGSVVDYYYNHLMKSAAARVSVHCDFDPLSDSAAENKFDEIINDADLTYDADDIVVQVNRVENFLFSSLELYFDAVDGTHIFKRGVAIRLGSTQPETITELGDVLKIGFVSFAAVGTYSNATPTSQLEYFPNVKSSTRTAILEKMDFNFAHCSAVPSGT